jgi:hypothetical protein
MPQRDVWILQGVESSKHRVIVLRAWRDPQGTRVRVLAANGSGQQWMVAGVEDTCALIARLLNELEEPSIPSDTRD